MINQSRTEINVKRLLTRCELMAKDDCKNWKLEKYILALESMMKELSTSPNTPSKDTMTKYQKRIEFLKNLVDIAKLDNPVEKVAAVQMSKNLTMLDDSDSLNITAQIHQKTTAKYNQELQDELFSNKKGVGTSEVRQRQLTSNAQSEDLEAILKYNRNMQEKIAENMLSMTNNMKEHALAARAIIKKDIGLLEKSDQLTDINSTKLKSESLKLEEHTKSNWRCWMWLMIAFVLVVFFNMILFMKVAKKGI